MRLTPLLTYLFLALLFLVGCSRSAESAQDLFKTDESAANGDLEFLSNGESAGLASPSKPEEALSSSTARVTGDTSRRFLLTGDLRFRAKDVVRTTFAIEELIAQQGGYVADTRLRTEIGHRYLTPISADSSLETTKFTVINRLTVRVPSAALDTTLKSLIAYVDFLDHRTLSATDVRLQLLRDQLTRSRIAKHETRLSDAIDEHGNKLKDAVAAEEQLLTRQEQADEAALHTLDLDDRIAYSTLTLDIYQREQIRRELLANEQNIEAYKPGFFTQATDALADGWSLLVQFSLFLLRSWSVILLTVLAYVLFRRFIRRA